MTCARFIWFSSSFLLPALLHGVEFLLHRVKERVLLLASDEHRKVAGGQVVLSERQMRVIEFIHAHGSVKSGDLVTLFKISRQATLKELTGMGKKDLIQCESERWGARYILH
jgi:hypothetical protein